MLQCQKKTSYGYRLCAMALILIVCMASLTGCYSPASAIVLQSKTVKVNVGDELDTNVATYVKASKSIMEEMTLNTSAVNMEQIGKYKAYVSYQKATAYFTVEVTDLKAPVIRLRANVFYMELGGTIQIDDIVESITDFSEYTYGFSDDMRLADSKKKMLESITLPEEGDYRYEVIAKDRYGNCSVKEFSVRVVGAGETPPEAEKVENYGAFMNTNTGVELTDLNGYSNQEQSYGVGQRVGEENRPELSYYVDTFGKYTVDFIQPSSKYVWLTFSSMYERGYTESILNTLREKGVSAVFFVTKQYMEKNPELVRRMIDEGHVLGNQTANGFTVASYSVNELTTEINLLYNYAHENYGYEMYLFRTPSGKFSEQTLAVAQSLGYRTVFWSFAYADWDADNQPDVSEALQNAKNRLHGGEILSLSSGSSTNATMLGDLIDAAREQGFEFGVYQKN